jgi:hypothetical protein
MYYTSISIFLSHWWLNELDSLGIKPKKINILNDIQELGSLTDNIKQTHYQDYKTSYGEDSIQSLNNNTIFVFVDFLSASLLEIISLHYTLNQLQS